MTTRSQHNDTPAADNSGARPKGTTQSRAADDLPAASPAAWMTELASLPIKARRATVREALPAIADRADWINAVRQAEIWSMSYLDKLIAEHAVDSEHQGDKQPRKKPRGEAQVPGSTWTYTLGQGVWNDQGDRLLNWCPLVTDNLVAYRDDGRIMGQQLTITVGQHTATVPIDEVETGRVWWDAFPRAAGTADRKIRDALTNIIRDQVSGLAETPAHPRWVEDQLQLPPSEVLPAGYLECGGTWAEWCHLVRRSMDTPKIALVMSLAVAGLFVKPLALQSFVVHLSGGSSRGKSTAAMMAAGIFGNPRDGQVLTNWDVSAKGLSSWLRGLRTLTGFRDELQSAGFRPQELQDTMLRITQGAERGVSTRSGMYRTPPAGWHGCLVSTGNKSIVGQVDNEAIFARVIEIEAPFTTDGPQSRAFKAMARENYGWGLPAIVERALTPREWMEWLSKGETDLDIPEGDVLGRAGQHLAGAIAGARLLGEICGIDDYQEPVFEAAKAALESMAADLASNGGTPGLRLRLAIADKVARNPLLFPTRKEYGAVTTVEWRMADILGWDLTTEDHDGDFAILPSGMKAISNEYEITDLTTALKQLNQEKLLVRNERGRDFARVISVGGKARRAYVMRGVLDAATEVDNADETRPVTTSVTTSVTTPETAPDLQGYDSYDKSGDEGSRTRDLATWPGDALMALIGPDSDDATMAAALAELERREKAPEINTDAQNPHSEGEHTHQGDSGRQNRSQGEKSAAPKGRGANSQVEADPDEWANWRRWLDRPEVAKWLDKAGIQADDDTARRALDAWHHATKGLRWAEYPGRTGINAYKRLQSQHPNMPQIDPCENELVNEITTGGNLVLLLDYVDPNQQPNLGEKITSFDVYSQFLAAAATVELGDGEPTVIDRPRGIEPLLKFPGYLELSRDIETDHPAFAGRDMSAGTPLPIPMARYLNDWGVNLQAKRAIVWEKKGQRLQAHARIFREGLEWLFQWDNAPSQIAQAAIKAVYATGYGGMLRSEKHNPDYVRRDWSDQLISLAWANGLRGLDRMTYAAPSKHPNGKRFTHKDVVKMAQSGAPRQCPPLGICKDTAYVWNNSDTPYIPAGLEIAEKKHGKWQPGKWRIEKHVTVNENIIQACNDASPYLLRDAVNHAAKGDQDD